jgi:hypothetical protein
MVPSNPIDLTALLLAFGLTFVYFKARMGQKMIANAEHLRQFALLFGSIMVVLAFEWQLAANLAIWITVIAAIRQF